MEVQHHHSEFTLNLLILITRMAAQGDYLAMQQLGIRHDQVDKLQALSTQEIQQMALISKARFVSIQVDPAAPTDQQQDSLWAIWQQLRHDSIGIPEQLLVLHEKTGLRIDAIWPLLQAWSQDAAEKNL